MTTEEMLAKLDKPPLPIIVEACDAYFRDKQELLRHRESHPDEKWVAYHGSQRIAFGTSQRLLVRECLDRGIPRGQFIVMGIDPTIERIMEATCN